MITIDPALLQLLVLGTRDDEPHLPAGQHLRWFPSPRIGFPHRGFQVLRRRSDRWSWEKRPDARIAEVRDMDLRPGAFDHDTGIRLPSLPEGAVNAARDAVSLDEPVTVRFGGAWEPAPAARVALRLRGPDKARVVLQAHQDHGDHDEPTTTTHAALGELEEWGYRDGSRVLLVDGPVVDGIVLVAPDVELMTVCWFDAAEYALREDWAPMGEFFLPIAAAGTYPGVGAPLRVARERLELHLPTSTSPMDDPAWPARTMSASEVAQWGGKRYLGEQLDRLQSVLAEIFVAEREELVPHPMLPLPGSHELTADIEGAGVVSMPLPAIPLLLAQALDPVLAGLLGLAWRDVDEPAPGTTYDYQVRGAYPGELLAESVDPNLGSARKVTTLTAFFTGVRREKTGPVTKPGLTAELAARPGASPVPAQVRLDWPAAEPGPVSEPGRVSVVVRREHAGVNQYVGQQDPQTGLNVLPLQGIGAGGRVDDQLPGLGPIRYCAWAMDLWGRFSEPAEAEVDVVDTVPPPAPWGLLAEHQGEPDAQGVFQETVVAFTWTGHSIGQAPDLAEFRIHVDAVRAVSSAAGLDVAPGVVVVEHLLAEPAVRTVPWPIPDGSAKDEPTADGGRRITVVIPQVASLLEAPAGPRVSSVTVVAVDAAGNVSSPAQPAVIQWYDPEPPATLPGLPGVERGTWPDAQERCWWRVAWPRDLLAARVQVLRADQARLLAAAGRPSTDLDALPEAEAAQVLRQLAADHPGVMVPAAAEPVPAVAGHLDVWIPAADPGLHVMAARSVSAGGIKARWPGPEGFTVVVGRRSQMPARPRLDVQRRDGGEVVVEVQAPDAVSVRVYRSLPDRPTDLADMAPLRPVDVQDDVAHVSDTVLEGEWRAYRAIAVGPSGAVSEPTPARWVHIPVPVSPTPGPSVP